MNEENINVDLGPVLKVLEALICEDPAPVLKATEVQAVLSLTSNIYELMRLHPSTESKIHREIGLNALAFLAKRVAIQKIAARSVKKIQDGGA